MFFEGLCRLFGFGCKTDVLTGNALNYVAAIACLKTAGKIAQPQRLELAEHFKRQQRELSRFTERRQDAPGASYKPSLAYAS